MNSYEIWSLGHKQWRNGNKIPANLIKWYLRIFYSQDVSLAAKIGAGTTFGHGGIGVVITGRAKIGKNCNIGNNVVIGHILNTSLSAPKIGDNVYIGAGAKILGAVNIGDNVSIGANAVVIADIDNDLTVGGIPAKPLQKKIFTTDLDTNEKFEEPISRSIRETFLHEGHILSSDAKYIDYDVIQHKKNLGNRFEGAYCIFSDGIYYKLKKEKNKLKVYIKYKKL